MADTQNRDSKHPPTSTRQLLDELDALMQRMLELPVGDAQEPVKTTKSVPGTLTEDPPEETEPRERSPAQQKQSSQEDPYSLEQNQQKYSYPPADPSTAPTKKHQPPENESQTIDVPAISSKDLATFQSRRSPEEVSPLIERLRRASEVYSTRRRWLAPLIWINKGFDGLTQFLGPIGNWLRSSGGRIALGWLGIVLFILALGWQVFLWLNWK